jgi:hypothetical protein
MQLDKFFAYKYAFGVFPGDTPGIQLVPQILYFV